MTSVLKLTHRKPSLLQKRLILLAQISFFFFLYALILVFLRNYIPDPPALIAKVQKFYGMYGYELVFLGALLEGTFMVGFYVPGSLVVLLGAALARTGVVSFPLVIFFGILGMCTGYTINYMLGRFGWYKILSGFGFEKGIETAKKKLLTYEDKAFLFGYIMPSTASFISTTAGVLKIPFRRFLLRTVLAQGFWSTFLGSLSYFFGLAFIRAFLEYFGFFLFLLLLLFMLRKMKRLK